MPKKQCANCGSEKFGLARQRWLALHFCKRECKAEFLANRKRQGEQTTRWLAYLRRATTLRS